jgi:hypothetical protein
MPSRRAPAALLALSAAIVFAGCYASTEPATDIGPETAKLNARGTANDGPATSAFEYWLTGTTQSHLQTAPRSWPAGASGPFSEKVSGLAAGSSYTFRICGGDVNGGGGCAQTRTFTTKPAVEDAVIGGFWAGCCGRFEVDAHSTATGAKPRGQLRSSGGDGYNSASFVGSVTCLVVQGSQAAVGAVGKVTYQPGGDTEDQTYLATIVDRRLERDTFNQVVTSGTTPPDCAGASFAHQGEIIIPGDDIVVNDAQP